MRSSFFHAVAIGVGIGAGIFGVPLVFSRVGLWQGSLLFWLLAAMILLSHLLYARVVFLSEGKHRLPGLVKMYAGKTAGKLAACVHIFHLFGAQAIYFIFGAALLAEMTRDLGWPIPFSAAVLGIFGLVFVTLRRGWRAYVKIEWESRLALFLVLGLIFVGALFQVSSAGPRPAPSVPVLQAFGIFLFSLTNFTGIPGFVSLLRRDGWEEIRKAICTSVFLTAFCVWLFGLLFAVLIDGTPTNNPAELMRLLPFGTQWLIPIMGFLGVGASFLMCVEELRLGFEHDQGVSRKKSLWVAMLPPLVIVIFVGQRFLPMMSIVGTVCGGLIGVLVALLGWHRFRVGASVRHWRALALLVGLAYTGGILYQFISWSR